MSADPAKNSTEIPHKLPGKPFVKGDPRTCRTGRPKDTVGLPELVRRELAKTVTTTKGGKILIIAAIVRRMAQKAMAGDVKAAAELFDRGWGRAPQTCDVTSAGEKVGGLPAIIRIIDDGAGNASPE